MKLASEDDRRIAERFITSPMHHGISIRLMDENEFRYDGHAYDLSETGICFEIDDPLPPGTEIAVMIHLPAGFDAGPGRAVFVTGRIIWLGDLDDPGPARMGAVFHGFSRAGDDLRLRRFLNQGIVRTAAA